MSKHTPGPWTIERCRCGHPSCRTYAIKGAGTFYNGNGFELADALLVASAPDMLSVLEESLSILEREYKTAKDRQAFADKVRSVISKAKGE